MRKLEEFLRKAGHGPVIVSACLLGMRTRYDGGSKETAALVEYVRSSCVVPLCPEQLGGLPTPRPKASLQGGDGAAVLAGSARVLDEAGRDVTEEFVRGAREMAAFARMAGARYAVLKEKSPSCGVEKVYVEGRLTDGCGVTTAALRELGIEVFVVP
jgi:uncharacterized protein YbbK (DUF523 family)